MGLFYISAENKTLVAKLSFFFAGSNFNYVDQRLITNRRCSTLNLITIAASYCREDSDGLHIWAVRQQHAGLVQMSYEHFLGGAIVFVVSVLLGHVSVNSTVSNLSAN